MNTTEIQQLTYSIKQRAREIGFNKVGIARAVKLPGTFLIEWLSRRYNGTMEWITRTAETRLDPAQYFTGAASIIATAVNYYTPDQMTPAGSMQISRYAVPGMRDYHTVLRSRLSALLTFIQEQVPEVEGKTAVDDAPVADKIWAAYAGIGWIGKNSILTTREFGSYVFLGELLVNIPLVYDSPIPDYCGTCRRCIDACPTGALSEGKVLDSTKCISYRTIEYRGEFPAEWHNQQGTWIFGCDICQEVCPWNRFARPTEIKEFTLKRNSRFLSLGEAETITREGFYRRFADSPIKRCKWEGFLRNVRSAQKTV